MLVFEASETPSQRGTLGTGQTVGGAKWTGQHFYWMKSHLHSMEPGETKSVHAKICAFPF